MPVAGAGSVGEVVIAVTVGSCACSVLTLLSGPPRAAHLEGGRETALAVQGSVLHCSAHSISCFTTGQPGRGRWTPTERGGDVMPNQILKPKSSLLRSSACSRRQPLNRIVQCFWTGAPQQ